MADSSRGAAPERDVARNLGICAFPVRSGRTEGVNRRALTPLLSVSPTDTTSTILIVSADRVARAFLGDNLSADGYEVLEAGAVASARRTLAQSPADLTLVDRDLPDGDGLELLRFIRDADQHVAHVDRDLPVIVISGAPSPLERIRGFERGCDDYLDRGELSYTELRARIAALLRRRRRIASIARLRVGGLEIDALARQVWVDGRPVALAGKEFSLLVTLAREPGRVFKRAELMATVWGWSDGGATAQRTRTLDSHASRLRRKLSARGASYVVNVWGVGYRLIDVPAPDPVEDAQLVA
ncbi:MAG: response regulator transcription factor [Acidobacteriota bacterium]|nr:response regulator transcription factor [Acidobacteriota bacterium]